MPFNMQDLNPVHKFYYTDSEDEWIELRQTPDAKTQEFRKELGIKQKRMREFDKGGKPVYVDTVNFDEDKLTKLSEMINDYSIFNWRLVTDAGEEIPCTSENKKKMLTECPPFANWYEKCLKTLKDEQEGLGEEVQGNF